MRIFVTGASGWIGSAVVPELQRAGHTVVGLARSDRAAATVAALGAEVLRGDLDDLDGLRAGAKTSDAVVHLGYVHDFSRMADSARVDRAVIDTFGEALEGTGRPLVIAGGTLGLPSGDRMATETDMPDPASHPRNANAHAALSLADRGVRVSLIRFAPTVHGTDDPGFVATLVAIARDKGVSAHIGDGANRWPAVHRLDAADLVRRAVEHAAEEHAAVKHAAMGHAAVKHAAEEHAAMEHPTTEHPTTEHPTTERQGSVLHAAAEEGVTTRDIAAAIGRGLRLPVVSLPADAAGDHFGWLGAFFGADAPVSSALTREKYGWTPTGPGLVADLDAGHYFRTR